MPEDRLKTDSDRVRYAGCTEAGTAVRLDGRLLTVYPTGAFVGMLPLRTGRNAFTFTATRDGKTAEKTIAVNRALPPPRVSTRPLAISDRWPMTPQPGALSLLPGEVLTVEFHGSPGGRAWFRIGQDSRRHPMHELTREADGVRERGTYRGEYAIDPGDAFVAAPICAGLEVRAPGIARPGVVTVLTGTMLTTAWNRVHETIAAREDDTPVFFAASREAARLTHLWRGTQLEVTGRRGDLLRVRLGATSFAWVSASDFRTDPTDGDALSLPPPPALPPDRALAVVGAPTLAWDDAARQAILRFPLHLPQGPSRPLPFLLTGGDGREPARLTLWGARPEAVSMPSAGARASRSHQLKSDGSERDARAPAALAIPEDGAAGDGLAWRLQPNPLLHTVTAARTDLLTLALEADTGPCWGTDVRFAGDAVEWRLRAPPPAAGRDAAEPLRGLAIVLDPGHGGGDSGAVGAAGLRESDANLAIAQRLAQLLEAGGARVLLTRASDTAVSLDDRVLWIARQNPDLVLSIHNNSVGEEEDPVAARGSLTFYSLGYQQPLARCLEDSLRGVGVPAPGVRFVRQAGFRVTRNCRAAPAALVECAFMSQPEDEALLLRRPFLDSLARGLYKGIAAFARGSATTPAEPAATRP
jgi:N-acetylmuramoyl-L-alanine amidase